MDLAGPSPAALARRLVVGLDEALRRLQGVTEFSAAEPCLLRVAPRRARMRLSLADGVTVEPGDIVLDLHLWNDRLGSGPGAGPSYGRAVALLARIRWSLTELAARLGAEPGAVKAIHARAAFVGRSRRAQLARLAARLGFETEPANATDLLQATHDLAENLWLWALAWTFNPVSLSRAAVLRSRHDLWMSAARLDRLYRHAPALRTDRAGAPRPGPAEGDA